MTTKGKTKMLETIKTLFNRGLFSCEEAMNFYKNGYMVVCGDGKVLKIIEEVNHE